MKIIFCFLFFSAHFFEASAFEVNDQWSESNQPRLNFSCSTHERFCLDLCDQEDTCSIELKVCRDCIGTSMAMNAVFSQMGKVFRSTKESVDFYEVIDFIKENHFVAFSSKSVYNQIEAYDSPVLQARFQSLCSEKITHPVVLFSLHKNSHKINKIRYVFCGESVYQMSDRPLVVKGELTSRPLF